jgi:hypothetical protein
MVFKSISSHAQYVTLQKYFSHPSLVLKVLFFNKKNKNNHKFLYWESKGITPKKKNSKKK